MAINEITFASGDGQAELQGLWHLPTRRATNGALIVMHGLDLDLSHPPLPEISQGAADLGLTVVRFDFRYLHDPRYSRDDLDSAMDDLRGAYNFLMSFGKEIQPKRIYIVGYSRGARTALYALGRENFLSGPVAGVVALMPALHNAHRTIWLEYQGHERLTLPKLIIGAERDPFASGAELTDFVAKLPGPTEFKLLTNCGHRFEPRPQSGLSVPTIAEKTAANLTQTTEWVLSWLAAQDSIREDLRK